MDGTPDVQAHLQRKVDLWRGVYERGDASVLCDALVARRNPPDLLLLHLKVERRYWQHLPRR